MQKWKKLAMSEYEELHSRYFKKIITDLKLTEQQIGLIVLIVRNEEEGGVDLASNLDDEYIVGALEDILKTIREQRDG